MRKHYVPFLLIFIVFFINGFSCNTTEPPPPPDNGTITLSLEETSCTEAWVNIKTNGVSLPVDVNIINNDTTVTQVSNLSVEDTTIYISSLLPNKNYQLTAQFQGDNQAVTSNKLAVQTLDTTSNNFTWQTYTFGDPSGASSTLNDVTIINDNNIWAVGEIYTKDSTGHSSEPYSIVHWDGVQWNLKKLYYQSTSGNTIVLPNIRGIYYRDSGDIWLAAGSIFHWNGKSDTVQLVFSRLELSDQNSTIEKLWGNSSGLIYGVGNVGAIVVYNSGQWSELESQTKLNIYDVWGELNDLTLSTKIYAVASNKGGNFDKRILKLTTEKIDSVSTIGIPASIVGIWFKSKLQYYICGEGIYNKTDIENSSVWTTTKQNITKYYIEAIRGNNINDIFACGDFGQILHFNGIRWKSFLVSPNNMEIFYRLAVKVNTIALVGFEGNNSIIKIGKR